MKLATLILTAITLGFTLTARPALASKEVSGGNGVGGTLADATVYEAGKELTSSEIEKLLRIELPHVFEAFPMFAYITSRTVSMTGGKLWFLETRSLNPKCLNPLTLELDQTILACQNDVEVRIHESWWLSASPNERARLVLHEVLTALKFKDGKFGAVIPVTAKLLMTPMNGVDVAKTAFKLGFGYFMSADEMKTAVNAVFNLYAEVAGLKTKTAKVARIKDFIANPGVPLNEPKLVYLLSDTGKSMLKSLPEEHYLSQVDFAYVESLIMNAWWKKYGPR